MPWTPDLADTWAQAYGLVAKVMVAAAEEREGYCARLLGGGFTCHMRGLDEVPMATSGKVAKLTEIPGTNNGADSGEPYDRRVRPGETAETLI